MTEIERPLSHCAHILRVALIAIATCIAGSVQATTLKIATLSPDGSDWMRVMRETAARIDAETDGRVTLKFYPGGVMGDDKAVLRKMRVGQLQGAAITGGSLAQFYGDLQLYNLPMIFRGLDEVDYVRERMDPMLMRGLEEAGFVSFGFAEVGFAYAMSRERATTVADAQRQKVWIPDGDPGSAHAVRAFGITPIPLTIADVLGGLQTGLINGVAMPPVAALALQWHTQLKYILDLPLVYVFGTVVVSDRAFGKLSDQDQQLLRGALHGAMNRINAANRDDYGEVMAVLAKQGLELVRPPLTASAEWQNYADTAVRNLLNEGVVSEAGYKSLISNLDAFRADSAGEDSDAVAD